jgi:hypothetical protein
MAKTSYPDQQRTLGSLLRLPYQELQDAVYGALASHGFADLRTAHSAVFRMAYLVDALTESGYLTTAPDPHDGRAKRVLLTRRGDKAMAALIALSAQFEQRLAERLGTTKMTRLRALLEEVAQVLESESPREEA